MFRYENLEKIRKDTGMTREDVLTAFRKTGNAVCLRTIMNWERGETAPKASDLALLCDIYGVQPALFFAPISYRSDAVQKSVKKYAPKPNKLQGATDANR